MFGRRTFWFRFTAVLLLLTVAAGLFACELSTGGCEQVGRNSSQQTDDDCCVCCCVHVLPVIAFELTYVATVVPIPTFKSPVAPETAPLRIYHPPKA